MYSIQVPCDEHWEAHTPRNCQCFTPVPSPLCSIRRDRLARPLFIKRYTHCPPFSTVPNKTMDPSSTRGGGADRWLLVSIIGEGGETGASLWLSPETGRDCEGGDKRTGCNKRGGTIPPGSTGEGMYALVEVCVCVCSGWVGRRRG